MQQRYIVTIGDPVVGLYPAESKADAMAIVDRFTSRAAELGTLVDWSMFEEVSNPYSVHMV